MEISGPDRLVGAPDLTYAPTMEEQSDAIEGGNFFLGVLVSIGLLMAGIAIGYMIYSAIP